MTGGTGADRYVFAAGSGFDQINGFTVFEGDRIDLQGQTFAQGTSGDGDLLLTLSSRAAPSNSTASTRKRSHQASSPERRHACSKAPLRAPDEQRTPPITNTLLHSD